MRLGRYIDKKRQFLNFFGKTEIAILRCKKKREKEKRRKGEGSCFTAAFYKISLYIFLCMYFNFGLCSKDLN